jgi:glycosyltransferase involved in cell wall biosynthesis
MRIAMISTPFLTVPPREYGGTELVVHELTEGLTARGHEVTLFATGDSVTSAELRSLYPQAQWPPEPLSDLNHVSWALAHAAREGFDLVHAHSAVALAVARLVPGIPVVYTLHHVRDERLSAFYRYYPGIHYVAISADQARREVPLPSCTTIHHGLDPACFQWTARPGDYVVFVGRFAPEKGAHTAIDAAGRAGVRIRVAGEVHPVDREYGEREVVPRLTRAHVSYLGNVGMGVKVPLLRDARALLAPIEWNEPFGLILIEAMLSGCPAVAFPGGSVPELVEEGVTGFVVRDAQEMAATIRPGGPADDFDRERCRLRAVERFSRDRMVEDHLRLYERVVREARAAFPHLQVVRDGSTAVAGGRA